MRTLLIYIMPFVAPLVVMSQPTVNNAEDYIPGTTFYYYDCQTGGVAPGGTGANVTWNFSGLTATSNTITHAILSPSAIPSSSIFPSANMIEKYSDGTIIYNMKTAGGNFCVGVQDTTSNFTMNYSNSLLTSKRPITYGTTVVDTFANSFAASGFNFIGKGTCTVTGDGYGTLVLPTKTFSNVLRVKVLQFEKDSMTQFGSVSTSTFVTFMWFDGLNVNPLLSIDSLNSSSPGAPNIKTVKYIINDAANTTGIKHYEEQVRFNFYPNPVRNELIVISDHKVNIEITNAFGQIIKTLTMDSGRDKIVMEDYASGIYTLTYKTETISKAQKFVIQ
jgi:hypothetical protein